MRPMPTKLLAAALLIQSAGCVATRSGGTESVCGQWRTVTWSARDTADTVDQVKSNNGRRTAWCR